MDTSLLNNLDNELKKPLSKGCYSTVINHIESVINKHPNEIAIEYGSNKISYKDLYLYVNKAKEILNKNFNISKDKTCILYGSKDPLMIFMLIAVMCESAIPLMIDNINKLDIYIQKGNKDFEYIDVNKYKYLFNYEEIDRNISNSYKLDIKCLPHDKAYSIFTSGSTSEPKIITGIHESLTHFILWEKKLLNIVPGNKIGCITNLTFDVIFRDIFLALVSGATLCLPKKDFIKSPKNVFNWLENNNINILHIVPSILSFWLKTNLTDNKKNITSLKYILCAGECLYSDLILKWKSKFTESTTEFFNLYGPSETTLAKFAYKIPLNISYNELIPVGLPLSHTKYYILDDNYNIIQNDSKGNVIIRTRYPTIGYSKPSDNKSFLDNPYISNEKLFYTGDIGYINKQGLLVITGRANDTIKILGEKCDLQEIKNNVLNINDISNAEVVYFYHDGEIIIGCFVISDKYINDTDIRKSLKNSLSINFIPKIIKRIDNFPKLDNGKVNKQKLKNYLIQEYKNTSKIFIKTNNIDSLEDKISLTLQKEFQIEINNNTNFFDLGLSSLQLTQASIVLSDVLNTKIDILDLFEHTNITKLTKHLETKRL